MHEGMCQEEGQKSLGASGPGLVRVIHVVQDVPTPHNNALLEALNARSDVELHAWYWLARHPDYGFGSELASEVVAPDFYRSPWGTLGLLRRALLNRSEMWLVVAWSNRATKALLVLAWLSRRPINFWFDLPDDAEGTQRRRRTLARWFLLRSRARVFCVGDQAVQYFLDRGFGSDRLVNFPVVLSVGCSEGTVGEMGPQARAIAAARGDRLLVVTGSRITREKGFDLLVTAVADLPETVKEGILVVIVGQGEEDESLRDLITALRLDGTVTVIPWLSADEFRQVFCLSDLAVHPARRDAYGGTSLMALAVGRPLIGSHQAGAAVEIVTPGVNGWLYEAEDVNALTDLLMRALKDGDGLARMRTAMEQYRRESQRTPELAAGRLVDELI